MLTWLKRISWDWAPLSGMVMLVYMIQRGFMAVSKAGYTSLDLTHTMSIFFMTAAVAVFGIGFLADRLKAKWAIMLATVAGTVGLATAQSPWIFGIGFGIAAAVTKMIPFTAPLKSKDGNDAVRISPQAVAKTIGKGLFLIGLGSALKMMHFSTYVSIVAPIWAAIGLVAYHLVSKYNIELINWKWDTVKVILTNPKWYMFALLYAFSSVVYYYVVPMIIPALISTGLDKAAAASVFGIGTIALFPLRFGFAWLADKFTIHKHLFIGICAWYFSLLFVIPVLPLIGAWSFIVSSKGSTVTYWPMLKQWVGKQYIGTAMGLTLVVSYLAVGIILGKW